MTTHPKVIMPKERLRHERMTRLRELLRLATVEGQRGGYRGGARADSVRAQWCGEWANELRKLEKEQARWGAT